MIWVFCGSCDCTKTACSRKFQIISHCQKNALDQSDLPVLLSFIISSFCILIAINETKKESGLVWSRPAPGMLSNNEIWVFSDPQSPWNGLVPDLSILEHAEYISLEQTCPWNALYQTGLPPPVKSRNLVESS